MQYFKYCFFFLFFFFFSQHPKAEGQHLWLGFSYTHLVWLCEIGIMYIMHEFYLTFRWGIMLTLNTIHDILLQKANHVKNKREKKKWEVHLMCHWLVQKVAPFSPCWGSLSTYTLSLFSGNLNELFLPNAFIMCDKLVQAAMKSEKGERWKSKYSKSSCHHRSRHSLRIHQLYNKQCFIIYCIEDTQ